MTVALFLAIRAFYMDSPNLTGGWGRSANSRSLHHKIGTKVANFGFGRLASGTQIMAYAICGLFWKTAYSLRGNGIDLIVAE